MKVIENIRVNNLDWDILFSIAENMGFKVLFTNYEFIISKDGNEILVSKDKVIVPDNIRLLFIELINRYLSYKCKTISKIPNKMKVMLRKRLF